LSRKQMHTLNRALLWGRGERKIDVVDLLAGLACADAPNRLVPPEQLVAYDGRGRWRARAVGFLIFLLMIGAATAGFIYLERNPLPTRPARPAYSPAPAVAGNETAAPAGENQDQNKSGGETNVEKGAAAAKAPPAQSAAAKSPTKPAETPAVQKPAAATNAVRPPPAAAGPIVLEFDKDTYVATESDGSVRIVVERRGSKDRPVTFRWSLRGNSAEAGSDFAGIGPGTETIPAGASTATLTIPLVSDAIVENTEVFLVEIEPAQAGVTLGERSHAAVIVVDDD
jgi:hypothetical protein